MAEPNKQHPSEVLALGNYLTLLCEAIEALFESEDDTGCSGDVTVVNKSAINHLRYLYGLPSGKKLKCGAITSS